MNDPVSLSDLPAALDLDEHEMVSLVGGGGKTTTLFVLAHHLNGSRLVTTTTKMGSDRRSGLPVLLSPTDDELVAAVKADDAVLVWSEADHRKAVGVSPEQCDRWFELVDHVLVEADGSRRRPFKAPEVHEPVVPAMTTLLIACLGAAALGRPIAAGCFRPDRVAEIAECTPDDELTPERAAAVLVHPNGSRKGQPIGARYLVLVSNVDEQSAADVSRLFDVLGSGVTTLATAHTDEAPGLY